jgi:ABC-type Fe3+/spermidine/putrescine transport system ATPase subunit
MESGRIRQVGSPVDLYVRPADRFVADFVGIANFVPATIRAIAPDGEIHMESALGPLRARANATYGVGQQITVLIRPGAISLSEEPGGNRVRASIRSSSFLGGARRNQVEVGGLRLVVDQPLGSGDEVRSEVWLGVDPVGLHLLPAEGS